MKGKVFFINGSKFVISKSLVMKLHGVDNINEQHNVAKAMKWVFLEDKKEKSYMKRRIICRACHRPMITPEDGYQPECVYCETIVPDAGDWNARLKEEENQRMIVEQRTKMKERKQ